MENESKTLEERLGILTSSKRDIITTTFIEKGHIFSKEFLDSFFDRMIASRFNGHTIETIDLMKKTDFVREGFRRYYQLDEEFVENLAAEIDPRLAISYYLDVGLVSEALNFAWKKGLKKEVRDIALANNDYYMAAIACKDIGNEEEARELFRKEAIECEAKGTWEDGSLNMARMCYENIGDYESASRVYEKAGDIVSAFRTIVEGKLVEKGKELLERVEKSYSGEIDCKGAEELYQLSKLSKDLGLTKKAESLRVKAKDFFCKEHPCIAARMAEEEGQLEEAIKLYQKELNNPEREVSDDVLRSLGKLGEKTGQLEIAIEAYSKIFPNGDDYASQLAFENGFHEDSIELFYKAVEYVFTQPCRTPFYYNSPLNEYIKRSEEYLSHYNGKTSLKKILSKVKKKMSKIFQEFHEIAESDYLAREDYQSAAFHAQILEKEDAAEVYRNLTEKTSE